MKKKKFEASPVKTELKKKIEPAPITYTLDYTIPRKNRFSAEDVAIKKPGYKFIAKVLEAKMTVKEVTNSIDIDNNRMIHVDEFK